MVPGSPLSRLSLPLLLAIQVAEGTRPATAQDRSATVEVSVVAQGSNRPIAGASIMLAGGAVHALTDGSGRARLAHVGTGQQTVEVRYLGYAPVRLPVSLAEGVREMAFQLAPAPVRLAELKVRAPGGARTLEMGGFSMRRRNGNGTFITREEIERQQPRYLSDLLRRLPGISLSTPNKFGRSQTTMRGATSRSCQPQVFVDGVQTSIFYLDDVLPGNVEGLEIYRGAATIPAQFNRGMAICGVVLVWTRER